MYIYYIYYIHFFEIFVFIIKEIKSFYNVKNSSIAVFPMMDYSDEEVFNFLVIFRKGTIHNKLVCDLRYNIVINSSFPRSAPEVFSMNNFIFPSLFDQRNLLYSILGKNWQSDITIEDIIKQIPAFSLRVQENHNNKYLVYYGEYNTDKVYNINDFLINNEINFFKSWEFLKSTTNISKEFKKDRYIILTDLYFLLFDPSPNNKNMAKLLFYGDIRQLNILKSENYYEHEKAHSYYLSWRDGNVDIVTFDILFMNVFFNQTIMVNPVQDFIDGVNLKSQRLKDYFRVFQEDYSKPLENIIRNGKNVDNLNALIKYNEMKFVIYKSVFLANTLQMLYKQIYKYYSGIDKERANVFQEKIKGLNANGVMYENKIIENYDIIYNITNNFGLSRSYCNTFRED